MASTLSPLRPVFVGLQIGLHVLLLALIAFAIWRAVVVDPESLGRLLVACAVFVALYACGFLSFKVPIAHRPVVVRVWVGLLTLAWAALVWLRPEGVYLVFPLFFLYLHLLPLALGIASVVTATGIAIVTLGLHSGFTIGLIVGPLIGAAVAIFIGLGYRTLARESEEREQLVAELLETRDRLIEAEHEKGRLAERSRLARELHDTVAQGLSSVQMLLHAAERDFAVDQTVDQQDSSQGLEYLRLARETAADGLAETRQFIRELAPVALDAGLRAALGRLAIQQEAWSDSKGRALRIEVSAPEELDLSMSVQTAFLRVAQGALSNVVRHAESSNAKVIVTVTDSRAKLTVWDDGVGFDASQVDQAHSAIARAGAAKSSGDAKPSGTRDSFGLRAISERVEQLGGTLSIESGANTGTTLTVEIPIEKTPTGLVPVLHDDVTAHGSEGDL